MDVGVPFIGQEGHGLGKLIGVGVVLYEVPVSVNNFFDVPVLPIVGNKKGQRWWIVFIVVTVCRQEFHFGQCSGFWEFGVVDFIRVSPGQQNEF